MRHIRKFRFGIAFVLLQLGCGDFNPWDATGVETGSGGAEADGGASGGEDGGADTGDPPPFTVFVADNYDYDHPDVPGACVSNDVDSNGFAYLEYFDWLGFDVDYRFDPYALVSPDQVSEHVDWVDSSVAPYGEDSSAADGSWIAVYSGHGRSNAMAFNTTHPHAQEPGACHVDLNLENELGGENGAAKAAVWDASCMGWHAGPDTDFHLLPQDEDGFSLYDIDQLLPFFCSLDSKINSHFAFFDSPWTTSDMAGSFVQMQDYMGAERSWMNMYYEPLLNVVNQPIVYMWGTDKFDAWDRINYANMITGDRLTEPYAFESPEAVVGISQLGRDGSSLLYGQFSPYVDAEATNCADSAPIWMSNCVPWE